MKTYLEMALQQNEMSVVIAGGMYVCMDSNDNGICLTIIISAS